MAKKRKKNQKFAVEYKEGETHIIYVSKAASELYGEVLRIQTAILQTLRILSRLKRFRNSIIISVCFQLRESVREYTLETDHQFIADEIARLSYIMEDSVRLLAKLSNSRIPCLEESRFKLTYGQTPKKRDPAGSYGSKKLEG